MRRNIISGNDGYGILFDSLAHDNQILGNFVGTDVHGSFAIPNATGCPGGPPNGILIANSQRNQIGGGTPGSGNLISGNIGYGLAIWYALSQDNVIQGNFVGTDATGTFALSNTGGGVSSGMGAP